ncbi:MAG: rod shape-determining protein MreD [Actinomycetota bacterium]
MRGLRPILITLMLAVLGLVIQATLFRRFTWLTPDLVVLVVILAAISLPPAGALVAGFLAGAVVDISVASSVLGLRSLTYTVVAYLAIRTRERTDLGIFAVGLWAGILSLVSVVVLLVVGILFGQSAELGDRMLRRLIQVPVANLVVGLLLAVPITRLLHLGGGSPR